MPDNKIVALILYKFMVSFVIKTSTNLQYICQLTYKDCLKCHSILIDSGFEMVLGCRVDNLININSKNGVLLHNKIFSYLIFSKKTYHE